MVTRDPLPNSSPHLFEHFFNVFLLFGTTVILAGCSLFESSEPTWRIPPDQPGVLRVATADSGGYIRLEYSNGDFQAKSLKLDPGKYTIVVQNVDHPGNIGFFMSRPDRWGREQSDGHVVAGGGIGRGEEKVFEAELLPESTYLFSDPVTQSPSHQILTGPGLPGATPKRAANPDLDPAASVEELTPIDTTSEPAEENEPPTIIGSQAFDTLGLDDVVPPEATDAPPGAAKLEAADNTAETATKADTAEKEPLVKLLPPTPGNELPGDKKPEPPAADDEDLQFSPEIEKLLDAFDDIEN